MANYNLTMTKKQLTVKCAGKTMEKDLIITGPTSDPTSIEEVATTEDLDMADGNMIITPNEGQAFSSVTINKPDTMIPENIKKDINIGGVVGTLESGGSGGTSTIDSVTYYKNTRPSNWPYFPLPSEMTEEDDVIYMLYDASGYMCCPAFRVNFTSCTCTIMKYMDTVLVNSYTESVTRDYIKYLQFYEEDEDYSTYNYIVIKLQGTITTHDLIRAPKFNSVSYNSYSSSELLEVSGKCSGCDISLSGDSIQRHQHIMYYSFLGVISTTMNNMFNNCYSLQTIPQLDTSKVTDMNYMFRSCISLQAIPELDTSKVTNMRYMFNKCYSLQTIPLLDTSNVTNMSYMFYYCYSLQSIPQLDTSSVTDMSGMFSGCSAIQTIPQLNTSSVTNMSAIFQECYSLQTIPLLDTSKVTNMSYMFYSCRSLQTIPLLDTSSVTTMNNMFYSCYSLQSIPELNTSSATNMNRMFYSCGSLQTIPLLDTSSVTNMDNMFRHCYSLQTIPELDTGIVTAISDIFYQCYILQKAPIFNPSVSFSLYQSTMLTRENILVVLNNLATVTTATTLTLGSTNLAKLTDEDKAIATNKGWTLA